MSGATDKINLADSLVEHELVSKVFQDSQEVLWDNPAVNAAWETEAVLGRQSTEFEFFITRCGHTLAHLLGLLDQLVRIPAYIRDYQRSDQLVKAGANRVSHLIYHFENFLIRAKSVEDRCLQLVNAVLHFGMAPDTVSFRPLRQNAYIQSDEDLASSLDGIHRLVQPVAGERNRLVHQRGLLDEELRKLEFYLLVQRSVPDRKDWATGKYMTLARRLGSEKALEVEDFLIEAGIALHDLFDVLLPAYERQRSRF